MKKLRDSVAANCGCRSRSGQRNHAIAAVACFFTSAPLLVSADDRRESDSPFKIEDFAPQRGRYTLNAGIGYAIADSKNVEVSTVTVPLSHGYSLLVPDVTVNNRRRDSVFTRLGMRYALSDGLNINVSLKADADRSIIRENSKTRTERDSGWHSLTAGIDYRLTSSFDQPFVQTFAEVALVEDDDNGTSRGKAATVGISSHWAFDPAILSLTGTYSYLGIRRNNGKNYDPGDVLGLAASFGIAINPEISIRLGLAQGFRTGEKIDGARRDWVSNTAFSLGCTKRISPRLVMNVDAQVGVGGSESTQMLANFTWRP